MNRYALIVIFSLFAITSHASSPGTLFPIKPVFADSNHITQASSTGQVVIRYQVTKNSNQMGDICPSNLPTGITFLESTSSNQKRCCAGNALSRGDTCELLLRVDLAQFIAGRGRFLSENMTSMSQLQVGTRIAPITVCSADKNGNNTSACSQTSPSDAVSATTTDTSQPPLIAVGYYRDVSVSYPLMGVSTDSGTSWTTAPAGIAPTSTSPTPTYIAKGSLGNTTCSGVVCIASGVYASEYNQWLLAVSTDSGASWLYSSEVSDPTTLSPAFGESRESIVQLTQGTCNTVSDTTTCIVAGAYEDTSGTPRNAVAVNTFDGTTWGTWTFPDSITAPTTTPTFSSGVGLTATAYNPILGTYMAVGSYLADLSTGISTQPFLTVSSTPTTASSWSSPTSFTDPTSVSSTSFNMASIACAQSGTGYCIAAGSYNFGSTLITPLAAISTTDNSTWSYPSALQSPVTLTSGNYAAVACGDTVCAIAGTYENGTDVGTLLGYITDTASGTWTFPTDITAFNPSAITVLNDTTIIAVGSSKSETFFIAVGTVSGSTVTWSYPTVSNLPSNAYLGALSSVYCQQGTDTCLAVGGYNTSSALLLSTDAGASWTFSDTMEVPDVKPVFSEGFLQGAGGA